MLAGFEQLSASFLEQVLSKAFREPVEVRKVRVTDYTDSPDNVRGARGLRKVDAETSRGPMRLMAKTLPQTRHREALIWRFLAEQGGLPVPEVYHVECNQRMSSYGVLIEYVGTLDETARWDASLASGVGRALATLHARFWNRTDELPDLFPRAPEDANPRVEQTVRRFLDRMSSGRQAMLGAMVPEVLTFLAKLLRMGRRFFAPPAGVPKTLIHGALDRHEVLFRPHAGGPEPVLIDWEDARQGWPTEDLASLIGSLTPEQRRRARGPLLHTYLDVLTELDLVGDPDRIDREIDRQRILQAGERLPEQCALYVKRHDDPAHQPWCRAFLDRAANDVPDLKRLLNTFADDQKIPEMPDVPE